LENQFNQKEIPRPLNWGGFLVRPQEVEFWQGRPNRLHDRIRYQLQADYSWKISRLAP
jgi:pyridoxamine 5'-phosphate oxidase